MLAVVFFVLSGIMFLVAGAMMLAGKASGALVAAVALSYFMNGLASPDKSKIQSSLIQNIGWIFVCALLAEIGSFFIWHSHRVAFGVVLFWIPAGAAMITVGGVHWSKHKQLQKKIRSPKYKPRHRKA